jgi:hypothetical protein
MTKYLKHYWKDGNSGEWLTTSNIVGHRHPEAEYAGLDVGIWMHDSDGVDVCLSKVPDSTAISTVTVGSKNAVIEVTETQFNSIKTLIDEEQVLRGEAADARAADDSSTQATKTSEADAKATEAQNALNAL